MQTKRSEKWDQHWLNMAELHASMSKDPSTKVGAVIVGPDRELISAGFNGFPRGIIDTVDRLEDRDRKLELVVHAEMNAAIAAARLGLRVKGCTLYLVAVDAKTGQKWGGAPCMRCSVHLIQAGISEVVTYPSDGIPERWKHDCRRAQDILIEGGVYYREIAA
jgi:dCMP deaminase